MKKVILALSVVGLMTACGTSNETETPKTDSTAVVAPASVEVSVGAVATTGAVATETVKTDSVPAVKK